MAKLLCTDCGYVFNDNLNACPECGNPASECTRVQDPQPQPQVQVQPQPQAPVQPQPQPQVQPQPEPRPVEATVIQPAQPVQQPQPVQKSQAVKTSHVAAEEKDGNLLEKLDRDWAHYAYECGVICWDCFTSKIFAFNGRASRREFWSFVLISPLVFLGISMVYGLITALGNTLVAATTRSFEMMSVTAVISAFIGFLLGLWWLIAFIAVSVRRMHDINHSGWWILVPVASLFLYLKKSDIGTNNYGEPSKIYFE